MNPSTPSNGIGMTNQMFGTPSALTSGAAGKSGIAQGPQLGMNTVAGGNLASNDEDILSLFPGGLSSLGAGK